MCKVWNHKALSRATVCSQGTWISLSPSDFHSDPFMNFHSIPQLLDEQSRGVNVQGLIYGGSAGLKWDCPSLTPDLWVDTGEKRLEMKTHRSQEARTSGLCPSSPTQVLWLGEWGLQLPHRRPQLSRGPTALFLTAPAALSMRRGREHGGLAAVVWVGRRLSEALNPDSLMWELIWSPHRFRQCTDCQSQFLEIKCVFISIHRRYFGTFYWDFSLIEAQLVFLLKS